MTRSLRSAASRIAQRAHALAGRVHGLLAVLHLALGRWHQRRAEAEQARRDGWGQR